MDSAQNGASETTISSGISSHSRNGEGECTDHDASKRRRARPPAQGTAHCIAQRTARRFCTVIVIGNGGNKHCGGTFGGECHRQRTPRKRTAIDIENGTLCGGRGISDHSEPQRADCIQKPESRASAMVCWSAAKERATAFGEGRFQKKWLGIKRYVSFSEICSVIRGSPQRMEGVTYSAATKTDGILHRVDSGRATAPMPIAQQTRTSSIRWETLCRRSPRPRSRECGGESASESGIAHRLRTECQRQTLSESTGSEELKEEDRSRGHHGTAPGHHSPFPLRRHLSAVAPPRPAHRWPMPQGLCFENTRYIG